MTRLVDVEIDAVLCEDGAHVAIYHYDGSERIELFELPSRVSEADFDHRRFAADWLAAERQVADWFRDRRG